MSDWTKYKVGTPTAKGSDKQDCQEFGTISHVSHVGSALSILERGKIRPSLVSGKSILKDRGILVNWLSPNDWVDGFRYGNIRFKFDFNTLIENKGFYWVESVAYKNTEACRILITAKDHDDKLDVYDPTRGEGPWWHDIKRDRHYFNGKYCLEFMFECALSLKSTTIDFVQHHPDYCSIHSTSPTRCQELGFRDLEGGAMLLAGAVASDYNLKKFKRHLVRGSGRPEAILESAFRELLNIVGREIECNGVRKAKSKKGRDTARAICSAVSLQQFNEAYRLATLFCTQEDFELALAKIVGKAVGLNSAELVDSII